MYPTIDGLTPEEIAQAYARPSLNKVEMPQIPIEAPSRQIIFIEEQIYKHLESMKSMPLVKTFIDYSVRNFRQDIASFSPSKMKTVIVNMDSVSKLQVNEIANNYFSGNIPIAMGALISFGYQRYSEVAKKAMQDFISEARGETVTIRPPLEANNNSVSHNAKILSAPKKNAAPVESKGRYAKKRRSSKREWPLIDEMPTDPQEIQRIKEFYNIHRLKSYRQILQMTQRQVSAAIGCDKDYMRRAESANDRYTLQASNEARLSMAVIYAEKAQELGINLEWLDGKPPKRREQKEVQD